LLAVGLALPGRAEEPSVPTAQEQARALLHEGNEKLDQGLYLDALAAFERAYAIFPSARLHYNMGQVCRELGRPLEALEHYERFVAEVTPDELPAQWKRAHERIFELQGAIAQVGIQCNLVDAQVTVDGSPAGVTPLARPLRLLPGAHGLVVSKPGYEHQVRELALRPGVTVTERIQLLTEEEGAATRRAVKQAEAERRAAEERLRQSAEAERRKRERARRNLRIAGWTMLGAGLATAAASAVVGGLSLYERAQVEGVARDTQWKAISDDNNRALAYYAAFYATLAVGGALVVAGGALIGWARRGDRNERGLAVRPALAPGALGLVVQGGF
jgi:tetratricopeptide (TPR) repeat protein